MRDLTSALSPSQPDPALLEKLASIQRVLLALVIFVGAATLWGWLIPPLGHLLPNGWMLMHTHTALTAVFGALSFLLSDDGQSKAMQKIGYIFASGMGILAFAILGEYWLDVSGFIDGLGGLVLDTNVNGPARMSPQSGTMFVLLSAEVFLLRARKSWLSPLADIIAATSCFVVLILASGYVSGALSLFGLSLSVRSAPQTLFCLVLLTFVAFWRRAEYGYFAVLLGGGIGSRIARILTPFVLVLPFIGEITRAGILRAGLMRLENASAIDTAFIAAAVFGLLLYMARRINGLEHEILDLSLRDELTGLYNRKGFLLLANQAFHLAERSQLPFSVLFVDLDGLKIVNDNYGHEAGSTLIADLGRILKGTFREADIVGRMGGDEFVVAGQVSEESAAIALLRLRDAVEIRNSTPGICHSLSYSAGLATSTPEHTDELDQLIARADMIMYQEKTEKKMVRV